MENILKFFFLLLCLILCTCGAKTDCVNKSKLAVIANLQSEICKNVSKFHIYSEDSINHFHHKYDFVNKNKIYEIIFLDTCGTSDGTLKAIFKTIMWADINCLHPPHFLGFIGPENLDDLVIAQKITSALQLPHIVTYQSASMNTHQIKPSSDTIIIQAIFKILEIFGWKSLYIQEDTNSSILKLSNTIISEAFKRNYCIAANKDAVSNILYIGDPDIKFFEGLYNYSVIIISAENVDSFIKNYNSTNSFLVFDNIRANQKDGDILSIEYKLREDKGISVLDRNNNLSFVLDAMKIYVSALNQLCQSQSCFSHKELNDWNKQITKTLDYFNNEEDLDKAKINFKIKENFKDINAMGKITYYKNNIKIYWNNRELSSIKTQNQPSIIHDLKSFFITSEKQFICSKINQNIKPINDEEIADNQQTKKVIVSELSETEWWSMVCTVAGVGIAMFSVGFFAVYIVYTNIRGPRNSKGSEKQDHERESSLRRVGSDRQTSSSVGRSSRIINGLQRRDSRSSIKSNISDKSV